MKKSNEVLSPELLRKMDAYWPAANYLSVGQIYLLDNPEHNHYIREHAMGAIVNGLSLSKLRPYGATFFILATMHAQRSDCRL